MPHLLLLTTLACTDVPPEPAGRAPDVARSAGEPTRILALGDVGRDTPEQARAAASAARVCAERGCDFAVLLGDNLYPRGMASPADPRMDAVVGDVYDDLGVPVYVVLGNHDWGHGRDLEAAQRQVRWAEGRPPYRMDGRFYSFAAGDVELFALDTTPLLYGSDPAQIAWLSAALRDSRAKWKVVLGHHPMRSEGKHGNAGQYDGAGWVPIAGGQHLRSFFDAEVCGRADLYLCGHDHLLQWLSWCGTELVVSGAGATARERIDRGNEPRFVAEVTGFAWLELGDELKVAFFDADGALLHEGVAAR